jgi:hypothetical protein
MQKDLKTKASLPLVTQMMERKADISFVNKLLVDNINVSLQQKADRRWVESELEAKAPLSSLYSFGNALDDKVSMKTMYEFSEAKVDKDVFQKFYKEINSLVIHNPDVSCSLSFFVAFSVSSASSLTLT